MNQYWIAVACADHVTIGHAGGFMQVCHGKRAPLERMHAGDGVVYYAPVQTLGQKKPLRQFTAIGHVLPTEPYAFAMRPDFVPWRRDVAWLPSRPVPVATLLDAMHWSQGKKHWAYPLRFGLLRIDAHDWDVISGAMQANTAT